MHKARIRRGIKPSWEPLIGLVGTDLVPGFMWMFAVELDDGTEVHGYKVASTRQYLHLASDGRAYGLRGDSSYEEITPAVALSRAFDGWEDAFPQPKHPEAVRALLERHRSVTSQEMH